jgi:hypothetical protein
MNRLTATQRRWTEQTAEHWLLAAGHRQRVMHLIETVAPAFGGRVCILGAGNCNDLDLPRLIERFAEVVLVDLDADALRRAAERQGVFSAGALRLHSGQDLTGVWEDLERLSHEPYRAELLDGVLARAANPSLAGLAAAFDVVVSTCVVSQLLLAVVSALEETHPRFLDLLTAVRRGHLRLMTDLAAPGGSILLVTDFVSSDSAPEIDAAAEYQLPALARRLVEGGNFFHGLNPAVVASLWTNDHKLAAETTGLQVAHPWRWDFGIRRYLVTAFLTKKQITPKK